MSEGHHPDGLSLDPMCNHYRADPVWREAMGEFSDIKIPVFKDRGVPNSVKAHVYPGRDGEILMVDEGELANAAAHWRFVPFHWKGSLKEWAKPSKPGAVRGLSCNNARGETADTTAMFREAAKSGRCLIPTHAFYEYAKEPGPDGKKIEYEFAPPAGGVLTHDQCAAWLDPANPVSRFLEVSPAGTFTVERAQKAA